MNRDDSDIDVGVPDREIDIPLPPKEDEDGDLDPGAEPWVLAETDAYPQ